MSRLDRDEAWQLFFIFGGAALCGGIAGGVFVWMLMR